MPSTPDLRPSFAAAHDAGRVAFGTILTAVLLLAAGAGAALFLVSIGVLSWPGADDVAEDQTPTTDATATPTALAGPAWLDGAGLALPPYYEPEDEREPRSREMAQWLWDYVDDEWDLRIVTEGDGGDGNNINDLQVLFLEAPDGELFRLYDLRRDYTLQEVHWDRERSLAWLRHADREVLAPVVQYDLREAENTDATWSGGAVSTANTVAGGIVNVTYVGDQPDGRELWASYDPSGFTTGLFWRDGAEFERGVMTAEIQRLRLQGYSEDEGVYAWVDPESMTAVYRATYRIDGEVDDERWILHDLSDDRFELVEPQVPSGADCVTPFEIDEPGQFDGDRIVARCNGNTVLIDPTGESGPQS